jgi:peptidoglycan/xylan/chitin deacetylase (PgdA/CDA1 family)
MNPSWEIDFSSLGGPGRGAGPLSPACRQALQAQVLVPPAAPWWSRKLQVLLAGAYARTPEWFRLGFSSAVLKLLGRGHGRGVGHCPRFLPASLLGELSRAVGGAGRAVLVNHDVDYTACYRAVLDLGAREARRGVRATYFFLTRASYRPERPVLRELVQMGHEVAVHGYTYDLRLAFRSPRGFRARLGRARALLEDALGEAVRGYRHHGMLLYWPPMLESLEAMGFRYESCLYPGTLNPVSRWYCWPFRYRGRGLWSVPVTWPEDSDAFRVRGLGEGEALEYYRWTLSAIASLGGVACFSFHPSTVAARPTFFAGFLDAVRDSGLLNPTAWELVRQRQDVLARAG